MNEDGVEKYGILVCGGRHLTAYRLLTVVLDKLRERYRITSLEIVSGHCQGADMLGEKYAEEHDFAVKVFPADWKRYGRAAGPIRNKEMIEYIMGFENRIVVAFTSTNTVGTQNTIALAKKAHILVVEIPYIPNDDNEALTKELYSIDSAYFIEYIEGMNKNHKVLQEVIERLKTDGIPHGAMYILSDGTILDLSALKNGHADLWAYLDERIPITSYPQYDIVNYLRDHGWIKINTKVGYVEKVCEVTNKQKEKIKEILKMIGAGTR